MKRAVLLALVVSITGCVPESSARSTSRATVALTLAPIPDVTIGGADERDGYAIGRLAGATLLDGRIVVGDGLAREVRFYELSGTLTNRTGRRGGGPGEFIAIRSVVQAGDSAVAVWDPQLRRITVVKEGGTPWSVQPDLSATLSTIPEFIGAIGAKRFVFRDKRSVMSLEGLPPGLIEDSIKYLLVDSAGGTAAVLRRRGDAEWLFREDGRWAREEVVFGRRAVGVISNGNLILGETDDLRFSVVDSRGENVRIIELEYRLAAANHRAVQAEKARLEAVKRAELEQLPRITVDGKPFLSDGWFERIYQQLPAESALPAYRSLHGDQESFWYCRDGADETNLCTNVANGMVVNTVQMSRRLLVHAFRSGSVLVSSLDSLDRPMVALYQLQKAVR